MGSERAEAEEKAEKEREEKEKLNTRPATTAAPPKAAGDNKEGSDEMELDEEDLKIIQDTKKKGYCYFKRTLSEKDQSLLDAEQMKLRAVSHSIVEDDFQRKWGLITSFIYRGGTPTSRRFSPC